MLITVIVVIITLVGTTGCKGGIFFGAGIFGKENAM
jgi:hypothetical protein